MTHLYGKSDKFDTSSDNSIRSRTPTRGIRIQLMSYKYMKMQRIQNIRRKSVIFFTLLRRCIFLMPAVIIAIYVTGHLLTKHPPIQVEGHQLQKKAVDTDAPETGHDVQHNTYEAMVSTGFEAESDNIYQVRRHKKIDFGVTVLAISSSHYIDLTKNWLRSIEPLHIFPNITIIATDIATYNELAIFPNLHLIQETLPTPKPDHRWYKDSRWKYVLDLLLGNQDVLLSDVDMVWLENPFPYLSQNQYDMFISWDPINKLSPGFIFLRSTENTIQFAKEFINRLPKEDSDTKLLNFMIDNQVIPELTYHILHPKTFISGRFYFNEEWRIHHANVSPAVIHANGINITYEDASHRHDVKIEHLKKHGLWYLNGNAKLTWKAGTASIAK